MLFNCSIIFIVFCTIDNVLATGKKIQKRQIYREEVLPYLGGKIPETAFETDRLLLNRLQKDGIAIPDGIMLQPRYPRVYALRVGDNRPVIRISPTSDERYTPPEGQYIHYSEPVEPIETTYPVPTFVYDTRNLDADNVISQPIYRQFNFPSPLLIETPFKPTENSNVAPNYQILQNVPTTPVTNYNNPLPQTNSFQSHTLQPNVLSNRYVSVPSLRRRSTFFGNVRRSMIRS